MTLEFTDQEINQLNEMIQGTPFRYAHQFFQFFQKKISDAQKAPSQVNTEDNGDKDAG